MMNRREALHGLSAGMAFAGIHSTGLVRSGEDAVLVGVVGCGRRGRVHARLLAGRKDARVSYVCDPDRTRAEQTALEVERICGRKPVAVQDLRRILDDSTVDAVAIATPAHWHAPATVLACDAGRHVYVESPCSHNVREGRLMVEAARRHKRAVQTGTQARNSNHICRAMQLLREGAIGDVLVAKAWNSQRRLNIGQGRPARPPVPLNYDLWLGPAPYEPYHASRLHGNWRWRFAWGTGVPGQHGAHQLDLARWGLGVDDQHPESVTARSATLFSEDDHEFPETRQLTLDYAPAGKNGRRRQLIFESRISPHCGRTGFENGNAFYGTKGFLLLGRNDSFKLYGERDRLIEEAPADGTSTRNTLLHHADFLDCIRGGRRPQADIEIGARSAAACHLGNIASRLNRTLFFDGTTEKFLGDGEANELLTRSYREGHWASLA